MKEGLYKALGDAKCQELYAKYQSFWNILELGQGRKNALLRGRVQEGIAKDFVREFLPPGFDISNGLIFDCAKRQMSPQCDAIVYNSSPLWQSGEVVIVEERQVKAALEVKSYIDTTAIFGEMAKGAKDRNSDTGLANDFKQKKTFLPTGAEYILFAFELWSAATDTEILRRLKDICDSYAIVVRKESRVEQKGGKEAEIYNFDSSASKLIEWLRKLS